MTHQKDAVKSGYWPLYRFQPSEVDDGQPFKLDSKAPSIPVRDFVADRGALRHPRAHRPGAGPRAVEPAPGRRRRAVALLRAARRDAPHGAARRAPSIPTIEPDVENDAGYRYEERGSPMTDLSTRYLGLDLRTPIVASASPLNGELATAQQVEDAGASAIVMPSLFEEEILHEEIELNRALEAGSGALRRGARLLPRRRRLRDRERPLPRVDRGAEGAVVGPGDRQPQRHQHVGGWARHAALIEQAGADALELNLYHVAADPRAGRGRRGSRPTSTSSAPCARAIGIPLAVKLSPYYSAMANFAPRCRRRRRRRARAVQPLLPTRPRSRHARGGQPGRAEPPGRAAPAAAVDRHPAPAARPGRLDRRDLGRPLRHRRREGADGRRRRRDDHLGRAPPRPRAPRASSRRS